MSLLWEHWVVSRRASMCWFCSGEALGCLDRRDISALPRFFWQLAVQISRPPQVGAGGARLCSAEVKGARGGEVRGRAGAGGGAQRRGLAMPVRRAPAYSCASRSLQDLAISSALLEENCAAVRLPFQRKILLLDALQ